MPGDIPQFYFDDLRVGQVFELGSITVSEEEMLIFAQHYDPQPFHLSIEQARETPLRKCLLDLFGKKTLCSLSAV